MSNNVCFALFSAYPQLINLHNFEMYRRKKNQFMLNFLLTVPDEEDEGISLWFSCSLNLLFCMEFKKKTCFISCQLENLDFSCVYICSCVTLGLHTYRKFLSMKRSAIYLKIHGTHVHLVINL